MFKGFIDDSTSNGTLVLGGYISHMDKWQSFSDEWETLLQGLKMTEFKMSGMNLSEEGRERAGWFYKVIEKHVLHRVAIIAPIQEIKDAVSAFRWPDNVYNTEFFSNPYFLAWKGIYMMVNTERINAGMEQPIDLVFDSQSEKAEILRAWLEFEKTATLNEINAVGGMPQFGDSKIILPLQAADFYAWWCRKWFINSSNIDEAAKAMDEPVFPWKTETTIPHLTIKLSKDIVTGVLEAMFKPENLSTSLELSDAAQAAQSS